MIADLNNIFSAAVGKDRHVIPPFIKRLAFGLEVITILLHHPHVLRLVALAASLGVIPYPIQMLRSDHPHNNSILLQVGIVLVILPALLQVGTSHHAESSLKGIIIITVAVIIAVIVVKWIALETRGHFRDLSGATIGTGLVGTVGHGHANTRSSLLTSIEHEICNRNQIQIWQLKLILTAILSTLNASAKTSTENSFSISSASFRLDAKANHKTFGLAVAKITGRSFISLEAIELML